MTVLITESQYWRKKGFGVGFSVVPKDVHVQEGPVKSATRRGRREGWSRRRRDKRSRGWSDVRKSWKLEKARKSLLS